MEEPFIPLTPEQEESLDRALELGKFSPHFRETVSQVREETAKLTPRSEPINVAYLGVASWNIGPPS